MTTVVRMLFGSHLYGLNTPSSDTDYKGVVLPSARQIIMQEAEFHISHSTGGSGKNTAEDIDDSMFSLQKFLRFAMKGETFAIDMLHGGEDKILETSPIWKDLVANRHKFYTKNMKAYVGYVRKQAAKYGVKGSRLAVLNDAITASKQLSDVITYDDGKGRPTTVADLLEHKMLPINEHANISVTDHDNIGQQRVYEI